MSSDPLSDVLSPAPESLAALTRERGAPLLAALEQHLPGAADHAEATASYAFAAAAELGHHRGRCELEREAARLHEVGLIYVPAAILAQAPAEAEQRWELSDHYEAGYRLALGAGLPEQVCGWLLRARERFDGGGPERLAAASIPIESRLIRAACLCQAMLASVPPHSGGTLPQLATEALRARSGRELDPTVAEALISVVERATASNPHRP